MPKASEPQQSHVSANKTQSQAGAKKSKPPKALQDVLLVLDWNSLEELGAEPLLGGLHRLLSPEKCRLHITHIGPPETLTDSEAMFNRIHANLHKFDFNIADDRFYPVEANVSERVTTDIQQGDYDLVVLCCPEAAKTGELHRHFVQSVTTHVPASVLIWRKPLSEQPRPLKVLLGADSSEASLTAANKLGTLLHLKYGHLLVVTVLSPVFQDNAVTAPFVNPDVLEQALEANANIVFEMIEGLLQTQDVPKPTCKKLIGSPATELGYYAEAEDPDVVVVGSHNRKGFLAWLLGSVSSQLLHWDKHNLLIVR